MHLIKNSIPEEGTSLDKEIREAQEETSSTKLLIDVLYDGILRDLILPGSDLHHYISEVKRTSEEIGSAREVVSDFYLNDSFPDFSPEEFEVVHQGFSFGLANYFIRRTQELHLPITASEDDLTPLVYTALVKLYQDPRDFILEYEQFQKWQSESNPLKANAFTFWLDCLFHFSRYQSYLEVLQEAKKGEAYVKNPFALRREINELLNSKAE